MNIFKLNKTLSLLSRLLDTKSPTTPVIASAPQKPSFNLKAPVKANATCEEVGVSSKTVNEFLLALKQDKTLNMHSVILYRQGKIFCSAQFGGQSTGSVKCTFSECKSVVSLAIGILIDENKLKLDDKIIDIFKDECNPIIRRRLKNLTVWHLLTMTASVNFSEADSVTSDNWVKDYLRNANDEYGKKFVYNSLNTYMLSAIVCKTVGKSLSTFLNEKLFKLMDITDYYWEKCPSGIEKGGWGLFMRPSDMLKIGILVMQNGVWMGKQLISAEYIRQATSAQVTTPKSNGAFNYGYQIWVGRDTNTFLFNGMFGQNILGFKKSGIIILSNAGNNELFQQSNYYKYALSSFSGKFGDTLPKQYIEQIKLANTIKSLSKPKKCCFIKAAIDRYKFKKAFTALSGTTYTATDSNAVGLLPIVLQIVGNNYSSGLESISFKAENDNFYIIYKENNSEYALPISPNKRVSKVLIFGGEPYILSSIARLAENEDFKRVLVIDLDFIETPCSRNLKIVFEDDSITLLQKEAPGKEIIDMNLAAFKANLSDNPIIASIMEKLDDDFTNYKLQNLFTPQITLYKN